MIKKLLLIITLLSISAFAEVVTKTTIKTAEGVGIGISRVEAINNALVEALRQINGTYISKTAILSAATVNSTEGNSSAYIYSNKIKSITKGRVDSFSILEVNDMGDQYEARVSVINKKVTKSYKTPGLNPKNRRTIAIIPSYINQNNYSILEQHKSAKDVSQKITQELVNSITKTRKFTVLDREANEAYIREKAILNSEDVSKDELLKLGQVLGADYLLVSNVTTLSILRNNATAKIVANMSDNYKASAIVQYRIISMATRQIKWSNTLNVQFKPSGNSSEQIYLDTLQKISKRITTELMENIYPIKIVDTSSEIIINQGSLEVGEEFDVYKLGKRIYDSYTKESLGKTEIRVGKIKVIRSTAKMSIAKVLEGNVSKGDICRTPKITKSLDYFNNPSDADYGGVKMKEGGGIVLPFD